MTNKINVVVPAGGAGKRFGNYDKPKPLIDIHGLTMIERVIDNLYHPDFNFTFCLLKEHEEKHNLSSIISAQMNCNFVILPMLTEGPAITASLAKDYIDSGPLIIVNCDQIIEDLDWDKFLDFSMNYDGVIGTFDSDNLKNSFAATDENGNVIKIREKEKIGPHALNGLHFWRNGNLFLDSVTKMVQANDRTNSEFYISNAFRYLIDEGKIIKTYKFNRHFPIGIPEDLEAYKNYLKNV